MDASVPQSSNMPSSHFAGIIKDTLWLSEGGPAALSKPRVCIVTPDLIGPIRNGGIGTAYTTMARVLADKGISVDILYVLGKTTETGTIEEWVKAYADDGITLIPLPDSTDEVFHISSERRISYRVMQWLLAADGNYNVVHFPDWRGCAYFTLLAKRQGFGLGRPDICIGAHSPDSWGREGARRLPSQLTDLETDFMERESVRLADVLISPTIYMLDWMRGAGFSLPARTYHLPNLAATQSVRTDHSDLRRPVKEIVFFGRLERRKGLDFFLSSLGKSDILKTPALAITFLGKAVDEGDGSTRDLIDEATTGWSCQVKTIVDYDSKAATEYLMGDGRLAVIPSLSDNAPYAIAECIAAQIPFLASNVGGIPEMIHPDDRTDILFDLWPQDLRNRLQDVLIHGARLVRSAYDASEVSRCWVEWHARTRPHALPVTSESRPKVSVCVAHHNRPHLLMQAIASLRRQDYQNFDVVLADSSTDPVAIEAVRSLEEEFADRSWTIVRVEDRYVGALRNAAVRVSTGDYLLFMDDDNYAKPCEISTFVSVATRTGADILTCMNSVFHGSAAPPSVDREFWLPLGGDLALGMFQNVFGDANAFVSRSAFDQIGGFTEIFGVGHEDYEFFSKATLLGLSLQVVPFSLYWYRHIDGSMSRRLNAKEGYHLSLSPLASSVRPDVYRGIQFAVGSWLDSQQKLDRLRRENSQLWLDKGWLAQERQRLMIELDVRNGSASHTGSACGLRSSTKGSRGALSFIGRIFGRRRRGKNESAIELVETSEFFDAEWYTQRYESHCSDPAAAATHFVQQGAAFGLDPGPRFSTSAYVADHPDVAASGLNPLVHYLTHGRAEIRKIQPSALASRRPF